MTTVTPKGWCPRLYRPMASGDGLLVRVKPPHATVQAAAARRLADAALRYGNGIVEMTSRAAILVRGLTPDTVAPFAASMVAAGLADPDPEVEDRRAVIEPPLADDCVRAVAAAVERELSCNPRLTSVPGKFAVAVDGAGALPLHDVGASIHVLCGDPDCVVTVSGTDEKINLAAPEIPKTVVDLALRLIDHLPRRPPAARTIGAIGWLPCGAFGHGWPFGSTAAAALISLADIAERYGDGTLRVTPWRTSLIPGVASETVGEVHDASKMLGLIVDPRDARLAIFACPGQPTCGSASVPARSDAARLVELDLPAAVHISGCIKGCAHPGPARITVVGEAGRYHIIRNGRTYDAASVRDLTFTQVKAALRR